MPARNEELMVSVYRRRGHAFARWRVLSVMIRTTILLVAAAGTLAGCAFVDGLPRLGETRVVARLEVFNRTIEPIFLVAADGERMDVPACGRALDDTFRIDQVRIRTKDGYIRGFGAGDVTLSGRHVVVIEVAQADLSGDPTLEPPPDPLPPCLGHPQVQVGV